jgi:hypothetical protein
VFVFASSIRVCGALAAVKVDDVARTEHVNVPVTADAAVTLMFNGEGMHVTPGVEVDAVTATGPVNPPLGDVTVTVDITPAPVAELSVTAVSATVKFPDAVPPVIVKVAAGELLGVKLGSPL